MKKIIAIAIAFIILIAGWFSISKSNQKSTTPGDKTISIIIEDRTGTNTTEIFKTEIKTEAEYLGEVLDQLVNSNSIEMEAVSSDFGRYITSFNGNDGSQFNAFWMFESSNNKVCLEAGFCNLGMDALPINDQDIFVFYLTNEY
jgi:hypothetical protein